MKKAKILFTFFVLIISCQSHAQTSVAGQLANHMAQKMKDTLGLSSQQKTDLYAINITLHNQKTAIRQQYINADSLKTHIQRIENRRDSLYNVVITGSTYILYQQKKNNLVQSN